MKRRTFCRYSLVGAVGAVLLPALEVTATNPAAPAFIGIKGRVLGSPSYTAYDALTPNGQFIERFVMPPGVGPGVAYQILSPEEIEERYPTWKPTTAGILMPRTTSLHRRRK